MSLDESKELISNLFISLEDINSIDARKLWEALGSKQRFVDWIKSRLEDFTEGTDFIVHKIMNNDFQVVTSNYILTLDTAKHISMLEKNDKGKEIRNYFIHCEKLIKEEELKQLESTRNKIELLQQEVQKLKYKLLPKPKGEKTVNVPQFIEGLFGEMVISHYKKLPQKELDKITLLESELLALEKQAIGINNAILIKQNELVLARKNLNKGIE